MSYRIENNQLISLNPATGEEVGRMEMQNTDQVDRAIDRCRKAFPAWRDTAFEDRAAALIRAGESLTQRKDEIGTLISQEMGKPIREAKGEASWTSSMIANDLVIAARQALETKEIEGGGIHTTMLHVPRGVVACVTPWNFPAGVPMQAVAGALLMGNTVIFKPSEHTALTGQLMAQVLQTELPEGVLEVVLGDGSTGEAVVKGDIDMVAFTGSQATGSKIMQHQGAKLNPVILELGGKDAMVVLDDADLEKAAQHAIGGSLRNCGQVCVSVERIYISEKNAPVFIDKLREGMASFTPDNPAKEDTRLGPMVCRTQRDKVVAQLEDARKKGATVEGGEVPEGPGEFIHPALVTGVDRSMIIMTEETFGPVIAVQVVANEEQAMAEANATEFGLGGSVWGGDKDRTAAFAARLEAGMVGINQGMSGAPGTPFVGAKKSGIGYYGGVEGMRQFAQLKKISHPV